jgi:Rhodopirellula transposase DDE domain
MTQSETVPRQSDPEQVLMHDFVLPELGRAAPYGVYDVAAKRPG